MDRDLALKFIEDKGREIEEFCYQLSMEHSSSLTTTKTPSSLVVLTHEGMSGTHDMRDHESFLLAKGLAIEKLVEKIPRGPAEKEVYAPVDWG
jgi:hypothetical protein